MTIGFGDMGIIGDLYMSSFSRGLKGGWNMNSVLQLLGDECHSPPLVLYTLYVLVLSTVPNMIYNFFRFLDFS